MKGKRQGRNQEAGPPRLTPEETALASALADAVASARRERPPSDNELVEWNRTHTTKLTVQDFASPSKAAVQLYYHTLRESALVEVQKDWVRDPVRADLARDGITAAEAAIVGASVKERLLRGAGVARQASPAAASPAAASPAAARDEGDLKAADLEKVHQLARRMEAAEREAKARGRRDGFPLGPDDMVEYNQAVTRGAYKGARALEPADLRYDQEARLAVYTHLAREAYRAERAEPGRGARGSQILGAWADEADAKRPGKLMGLLGKAKSIDYQNAPETDLAAGAEARIAARLVGTRDEGGPVRETRVAGRRAWLDAAAGQAGPRLSRETFAGSAAALEGYVYRGRDGRAIDAHHVPYIEAAAVRLANDLRSAPPSKDELARYTQVAAGLGQAGVSASTLEARAPAERLEFTRWLAAERWQEAAERYMQVHRGRGGGLLDSERYPERTGARTNVAFLELLAAAREKNLASWDQAVRQEKQSAKAEQAYRSSVLAARQPGADPLYAPLDQEKTTTSKPAQTVGIVAGV